MVHLLHAHCFVFVIFFLNRFHLFVCWQHSLKTKYRQSVLHVASLLLYFSCHCWNSKDIHFDYRINQLNMQTFFFRRQLSVLNDFVCFLWFFWGELQSQCSEHDSWLSVSGYYREQGQSHITGMIDALLGMLAEFKMFGEGWSEP